MQPDHESNRMFIAAVTAFSILLANILQLLQLCHM